MDELNKRLHSVIREKRNIIVRQFNKNTLLCCMGCWVENPQTIIVVDNDFRLKYQVKSETFIIATGSNPRNPPDVPFDKDVILDSTTLLGIKKVPKSMLVLGEESLDPSMQAFCSPWNASDSD